MYTRDVIGYLSVCGFALAEKCLPKRGQLQEKVMHFLRACAGGFYGLLCTVPQKLAPLHFLSRGPRFRKFSILCRLRDSEVKILFFRQLSFDLSFSPILPTAVIH